MPRFGEIFRTATLVLATTATGVASLAGATKLITTPQGSLFFSDELNVFRVNVATNRLELVLPGLAGSKLLIDAEGRLCGRQLRYEAARDLWRPVVWRFAGVNQPPEIVPEKRDTQFEFSDVVDRAGNLYFWESDRSEGFSRLLVRHRDGPVTLLAGHHWGARDGHGVDAQLGNLGGLAIGPDGCVYFSDGPAVRKITRGGDVVTLARGGLLSGRDASVHNSITPNPLSFLAVDQLNFVYVVDTSTARLLRISPSGDVVWLGDGGAKDWTPEGLAAKDGAVYLAESRQGEARVRRLGETGLASTIAIRPALDSSEPAYSNPVWLSRRAEGVVPTERPRIPAPSNLLQIPAKRN